MLKYAIFKIQAVIPGKTTSPYLRMRDWLIDGKNRIATLTWLNRQGLVKAHLAHVRWFAVSEWLAVLIQPSSDRQQPDGSCHEFYTNNDRRLGREQQQLERVHSTSHQSL